MSCKYFLPLRLLLSISLVISPRLTHVKALGLHIVLCTGILYALLAVLALGLIFWILIHKDTIGILVVLGGTGTLEVLGICRCWHL